MKTGKAMLAAMAVLLCVFCLTACGAAAPAESTPKVTATPGAEPVAAPEPTEIPRQRSRPPENYYDYPHPKPIRWPGELLESYEDDTEYGDLANWELYGQADYYGVVAQVTDHVLMLTQAEMLEADEKTRAVNGTAVLPLTVVFDEDVDISAVTIRAYGGGYDVYSATLDDLQTGRTVLLHVEEQEDRALLKATKILVCTYEYDWFSEEDYEAMRNGTYKK